MMLRHAVASLLSLIIITAIPVLSGDAPVPMTVDPSQGVIDGDMAIGFWPCQGEPECIVFDPTGFQVVLIPVADPDHRLIQPCGEWFFPPDGLYNGLVEGPSRISPDPIRMGFRRAKAVSGHGMATAVPVVAAGMISLEVPLAEASQGPPLTVSATRPGGSACPWGLVALLIDGNLLYGPVLAWLTRTSGGTDHQGRWQPQFLPARDLRLLVWTNDNDVTEQALSGALGHRVEHLAYPWPLSLSIEAVE